MKAIKVAAPGDTNPSDAAAWSAPHPDAPYKQKIESVTSQRGRPTVMEVAVRVHESGFDEAREADDAEQRCRKRHER